MSNGGNMGNAGNNSGGNSNYSSCVMEFEVHITKGKNCIFTIYVTMQWLREREGEGKSEFLAGTCYTSAQMCFTVCIYIPPSVAPPTPVDTCICRTSTKCNSTEEDCGTDICI